MLVEILSSITPVQAVTTTVVVYLSTFVITLVRRRLEWRKHNYPGPPHDFLWGHLKVFHEAGQLHPPDVHHDFPGMTLAAKYGSVVCLDLWPIRDDMVIVSDPHLADKICRVDNLPKCLKVMLDHDVPIMTKESILLAPSDDEGNLHWSTVRKALNPGFKKGHLERSWTADIVKEINRMVARLNERAADGKVFHMSKYLTDATCDIILKIVISKSDPILRSKVLDILNAQLDHILTQNRVMPILDRFNPWRRYGEWKRSTNMNNLLGPIIDDHIEEHAQGVVKDKMDVVDCALADHPMSKLNLLGQVRTFIFAGHDTTSVTLAWTYYYLAKNHKLLVSVREELQRVFGPAGTEAEQIIQNPLILNELKVVNAILKETLRMHPPAASAREGPTDYFIQHPKTKEAYPVEGFLLWVNHYILHRNPDTFPDPETFNPDRWLDSNADSASMSYVWQPFSKGPKNCIGMELALLEQRIILVLTARKFIFEYADSKDPYPVYRITPVPNNFIPLRVRHSDAE
ncbi:cytochrome P450 [Flagelloscypha sp. PMI_526]|nr:cytochrome P450 [Flagelloscypha sp. PMI_526]